MMARYYVSTFRGVPRTPPPLEPDAVLAWCRTISHTGGSGPYAESILRRASLEQIAAAVERLELEAARLEELGHRMAAASHRGQAYRAGRYLEAERHRRELEPVTT